MNIFILDEDISSNAIAHCDKHVVKMILESAQMLMSAYHITGHEKALQHPYMYRLTHTNHPCTKWVVENTANWNYLFRLVMLLNAEYKFRFEKKTDHLSMVKLIEIVETFGIPDLPISETVTPFAQAMPEQYRRENAVEAYRAYYKNEKSHLLKYTKRKIPIWITE